MRRFGNINFETKSKRRAHIVLLCVLALPGPSLASTPTLTTLHSFAGADGQYPIGGIAAGCDGNFFGSTAAGGANGAGAIYKVTPAGTLTTLYSFSAVNASGDNADGTDPQSRLNQDSNGNFYGTTRTGGASGYGTVFKITTEGKLTSLHSFTSADGAYPEASLTKGGDGNFYGTTSGGGANNGSGTFFRITPAGNLTTLYSFGATNKDGQYPNGLVVGSDGNFYGTTCAGGASRQGVVFKITPAGVSTTLHAFSGLDGMWPSASLVCGGDGNFYGTTFYGGPSYIYEVNTGSGTVFRITPSGMLTTLHSFCGPDGKNPQAELAPGNDGDLYGTTYSGGENGNGTAFKMTLSGTFTTLHWFTGAADAAHPDTLTFGSDGSFYGATNGGGAKDDGTVFKLTPPADSTYVLWNNTGVAAVWKISATGSIANASFGPYAGWTPNALSSDATGNAYILWTTATGGISIWRITPALTVAMSQSFGPYSGWAFKSIATGPDDHVHVLWKHTSDNEASIFNITLGMSYTSKAYGPYANWQAQQIAVDYNNDTRVLWSDTAIGEASLWSITSAGDQTSQNFGPLPGWQAQSLVLAPGGQPRILWVNTSTRQASLFTVAPNGSYTSQAFGPYAGWSPAGLAINNDGDSELTWNSTTNQLSILDIGQTGTVTPIAYGPISGWKAIAVAPGP